MSDDPGLGPDRQIDISKGTDVGIASIKGKVVLWWRKPQTEISFEPQNAFEFAEHLARCAHATRFPGERIPEDFHYLAQQIKQRLTEDIRDRLIVRIGTMLPSLLEKKDLTYLATQVVDTIFSAIDNESYTKLRPAGGPKYDA